MERCPTCQARLKDAPVCPRCKTDLSSLLSIKAQAEGWLRQAFALLAAGDADQAFAAVEQSLRLKREPLALCLLGFLSKRSLHDAKTRSAELDCEQGLERHGLGEELVEQAGKLARRLGQAIHLDRLHLPE
jgi:hypothetical protein